MRSIDAPLVFARLNQNARLLSPCRKHHCPQEAGLLVACDAHPADRASEYKEKFIAHSNAEVRPAIHHRDEYHPPEGKMVNMTTFR